MTIDDLIAKAREWFGFAPTGSQGHAHGDHGHEGGHGHTHGVIDATIASTDRGIWAIKWSFIVLAITSAFQLVVVLSSGSVALLADTIHNIADATTAIPLWIAFMLARRKPTATFTYGYGRVEDLAGITIVLIILSSAMVAGYQATDRLIHPQPITLLGWVAAAGIIGFIGNEIVAVLRIRVGREINSAALIADGYHARTDGLTSLAVVGGALGVWLGFPLADPIIGLLITVAILGIVWQSARSVLTRMLDGVEPGLVGEIHHSGEHVAGIKKVLDVKARWLGHKLHADVAILVDAASTVAEADRITAALKDELFAHIPALTDANVRVHGSEPSAHVASAVVVTSGHHHAPEPFCFTSPLADGAVEIIDTPQGERMRMTARRQLDGLSARVIIDRGAALTETLELAPAATNRTEFTSAVAPAEPHEFHARLHLAAADRSDVLQFRMVEPVGHNH